MSKTTKNPVDYLNDLEEKVSKYPNKLECLIRLKECMSENNDAFDAEDNSLVNNEIDKFSKEYDKLKKEWMIKNHLFNESLAKLDETLQLREKILNDVNTQTSLFSHHPSLTHQFAAKQAELVKIKNSLLDQLYLEQK